MTGHASSCTAARSASSKATARGRTIRGAEETTVLRFVNFDLDDAATWAAVRDVFETLYRSAIDGLETHAQHAALLSEERLSASTHSCYAT